MTPTVSGEDTEPDLSTLGKPPPKQDQNTPRKNLTRKTNILQKNATWKKEPNYHNKISAATLKKEKR